MCFEPFSRIVYFGFKGVASTSFVINNIFILFVAVQNFFVAKKILKLSQTLWIFSVQCTSRLPPSYKICGKWQINRPKGSWLIGFSTELGTVKNREEVKVKNEELNYLKSIDLSLSKDCTRFFFVRFIGLCWYFQNNYPHILWLTLNCKLEFDSP